MSSESEFLGRHSTPLGDVSLRWSEWTDPENGEVERTVVIYLHGDLEMENLRIVDQDGFDRLNV